MSSAPQKRPAKSDQNPRSPVRQAARPAAKAKRGLRLRLVDAVTLAAIGLLVLKVGALLADPPPSPLPPSSPSTARKFVQAWPGGNDPFDPTTTGSVTPKPEPKAETKTAEPPVYQPNIPEAVSPTEKALLEKLAARREALKQRQEALDQREQMLEAAERKLEAGTADLKVAEDRSEGGPARKAETEKSGLKGIVTMYETMKPKDAARVFDRLGHDVLVPIVLAMNPRKMAEILAVMGPEPAEKLTVALANRARGVETAAATAAPGLPAGELPAIDPGPARATP